MRRHTRKRARTGTLWVAGAAALLVGLPVLANLEQDAAPVVYQAGEQDLSREGQKIDRALVASQVSAWLEKNEEATTLTIGAVFY